MTDHPIDATAEAKQQQRVVRLGVKRTSGPRGRQDTEASEKITNNPPIDSFVDHRRPPSAVARPHGQLVPYHPIKAGSSLSAKLSDAFTTLDIPSYIKSLQIPSSTLEDFVFSMRSTSKGKEAVYDPFQVLFRMIHEDSHSLTDVIRESLQRIREDTLDEDLMQQRVTFWRKLFHQLNASLAELNQQLRAFKHFMSDLETPHLSASQRAELPSERLARDTEETLRSCLELLERSSMALLTEMQIVDSRRSIAEAESISKLTELAFVFIPLSFVASLFSMEVRELDGGVPVYVFIIAAIATVFIAYAMRLGIRSSRLIEYKSRMLVRVRATSHLPSNQPIPTGMFLTWVYTAISKSISNSSTKIFDFVAPLLLLTLAVAALTSPIVLLWLRGISMGFTIVITVLMLLLDAVLVYPLVKHGHRALGESPIDVIRGLRKSYSENQRKKAKQQQMLRDTLND
jgi:Mg2+ and Co2+ transporter CorA